MKTNVKKIIIVVILALIVPIIALLTGFCLPPQFSDTYYGELKYMFRRLKNAEGKKIVLIGNSALAFGVRPDLIKEEFPDYNVVNFGLYGVLGTKLMLDLSEVNISEGDIIIIIPELIEQTSSLYFSATDVWRAVDGDHLMLRHIKGENRSYMVGAFPTYVGEKFSYFSRIKDSSASGVYSASAFKDENGNEVGYMTYDRPHNVMAGGYDPANLDGYGVEAVADDFIKYLNEYARTAEKKKASVYFGFTPMNSLALGDKNAPEFSDGICSFLSEKLDFSLLGTPEKYFLDHEWFFDNNFHMNSAGAIVYTDLIVEDLKLALGITVPNKIVLPKKPEIPVNVVYGDNEDADCFVYEIRSGATGDYVRLTGLSEEGATRTYLTIPSDYGGVPVTEFSPEVFAGNRNIGTIVLSSNIGTIYDNSFDGAIRLSRLVFSHDSVLGINMGSDFLKGADDCLIYIKEGVSTVDCAGGWARYQGRIRYY